MTEHLTRHGADHDEDVRETTEVPGQERPDFEEPDESREPAGRHLSTADLASAADQPEPARGAAPTSDGEAETPPLIDEEKVTGFRDRWQNVQTGFVDDPKQAVRQADELVAAVISALATTFAEHKSELEGQWQQGEPATEELRIALRRYRSFFDQLLPG
ncbi:hypothetical protein [Amycolatopsis sp. NPDC004378]